MFKSLIKESRYCKNNGQYQQYIVPKAMEKKIPYYGYPQPFKFGFISLENRYEFKVPEIRTDANEFLIHTYKKMEYRPNGKIKFRNKYWIITNVSVSYEEDGFNVVEHYFLTVK